MELANNIETQRRLIEIQTLIGEVEKLAGSQAGERVQQVMRLVMDLHAEGLRRILSRVRESEGGGQAALRALADDALVAGLLLLHDLHPYNLDTRVRRAVEKVRSFLQSHGGDVELLAITQDAVSVRVKGECDACPAFADSFRLMVEKAIEDAAPDCGTIRVETARSELQQPWLHTNRLQGETQPAAGGTAPKSAQAQSATPPPIAPRQSAPQTAMPQGTP